MKRTEALPHAGARLLEAASAPLRQPVVIHVAGGGAWIISKPIGVSVEIHDFDTPSDRGELIEEFAANWEERDRRMVAG